MIYHVEHWRTECDHCGSSVTSKGDGKLSPTWHMWTLEHDGQVQAIKHFCPVCAVLVRNFMSETRGFDGQGAAE